MPSPGGRWRRRALGAALVAVVALGAPTPAPGEASGQPGGGAAAAVVRLPFPRDDGTLTPYTFELGYPLVTLVYDTLFWRDVDGVPQPWLARSAEVSVDQRELTVRLVEGATWHDGRPVTAEDVRFTFSFVATHPHPRFTPEVAAVEDVRAPDPSTVVIRLRHPSPGFWDQPLADLPVLPAHLWRDLPPGLSAPPGLPVGSGPYRLVEHVPGERYRFEANPAYFRGPPAVGALEVPVIGRADATIAAFRSRRVDLIPASLSEGAAASVDSFGTSIRRGVSYLGTALVLNMRRPPFDRVEVRRAVAGALDLTGMVRRVGEATPADRGYLHPASPWASSEVLHRFDPAAPAALAGVGLARVTVLAPENDPVKVQAGREVARALRRAGVEAESQAVPRESLARALGEDGSPPDFDAAVVAIPPLASHDPDFLTRVFGAGPQAHLNFAGYDSRPFADLASAVASEVDPASRRARVQEALRLLASDAPVVPLFFSTGAYAYRPAVYDGWVFVKGSGVLDKRSFLDHDRGVRPARSPPESPLDRRGRRLPLGYVAAGVAAVAAALAVATAFRRR